MLAKILLERVGRETDQKWNLNILSEFWTPDLQNLLCEYGMSDVRIKVFLALIIDGTVTPHSPPQSLHEPRHIL